MSRADSLPRTMVLGIHGVLDMYPWLRQLYISSGLEEDAFSLVVKRSVASQLTGFGKHRFDSALWDHNDAGGHWTQDGQQHELVWLQAMITTPEARLPIQPALSVLSDVLTRVGSWRFQAVHAVLPVSAAGEARYDLAAMWHWFTLADPTDVTEATIQIASNQAREIAARGAALCSEMQERSYGQLDLVAEPGPFTDALGGRRTGETFTTGMSVGAQFSSVVPEWSIDAIAWMLDIVVDALNATGLLAETLVTIAAKPRAT